MICITDRTLSLLDDMPYSAALARFLELLIKTEPDAIELSEKCLICYLLCLIIQITL